QCRDLVDAPASRAFPVAPLFTVNRTELSRPGLGPLVPDRDTVVMQEPDVRRSPEEPDQLDDDLAERHPLGCHQWKTRAQIIAILIPEDAPRPRLFPRLQDRPGVFLLPVFIDFAQEFKILFHRQRSRNRWTTSPAPTRKARRAR